MSSDRIRIRLRHIVQNGDRIAIYIAPHDAASFRADAMTRDAVERCLERIAEAIVQIGAEAVATLNLPVPFSDVRSLGNRLRHEYARIDPNIIFDTARSDIPPLRDAAQRALED
ncbi:HepT-like ribonuclease domain-containing protein [Sphingomonas sp. XXL09]|uniref:HepT-like ribonuclease domain-containing protein n=1 Tax=Sphingomonas sp. XXL09 TaxID=3457787 RepID=UPI00406BB5D9